MQFNVMVSWASWRGFCRVLIIEHVEIFVVLFREKSFKVNSGRLFRIRSEVFVLIGGLKEYEGVDFSYVDDSDVAELGAALECSCADHADAELAWDRRCRIPWRLGEYRRVRFDTGD